MFFFAGYRYDRRQNYVEIDVNKGVCSWYLKVGVNQWCQSKVIQYLKWTGAAYDGCEIIFNDCPINNKEMLETLKLIILLKLLTNENMEWRPCNPANRGMHQGIP